MYMIRRFSQPLCIINHHSFIVLRIIALVTCKNKLYILFTKNNIAVVSFLKAIPQKRFEKNWSQLSVYLLVVVRFYNHRD